MKHKNSDPAIVILTISDLHGQLEPTHIWGPNKTLLQAGGISRIATLVNTIKTTYPDKVLLLGSGDYFAEDFRKGRYFSAFGPELIANFLNALPIDASTIGNHEFDFGIDAADQSLLACSFPLIATNIAQSELSRHILKKLVINKDSYKIGILGVMLQDLAKYWFTHEMPKTSRAPIQFDPDLYGCMQAAVEDLKTVEMVDFVVVLSHIGIEEDTKLAQAVNGIDLICGGHTHATTPKGCEVVVEKTGPDITVISHPGDKGSTLGIIKLWPKENGHLTFECDVLEVNQQVPHDQKFKDKLQSYKEQFPPSQVVATSTCPIDATKDSLRKHENCFANFVTDTIKDYFGADIVLINASSIRGTEIIPAGDIKEDFLDHIFPFKNDYLIRLKSSGRQIRQALELGASDVQGSSRNLLHVSGLHYMIDLSRQACIPDIHEEGKIVGCKRNGNMIVRVNVEHNNTLVPLDDNQEYDIIINSMMIDEFFYLAQFYMFKMINDKQNTGLNLKDVLMEYFKTHPVISPNKIGRLIIKNN